MCLVDIETKTGLKIEVDKLNNGKYCITVDGVMMQRDLDADATIRWFANAMMN